MKKQTFSPLLVITFLGLPLAGSSNAAIALIGGTTNNGDFSSSTVSTGGANLKPNISGWQKASTRTDWSIDSNVAVADTGGTTSGLGQFLLQSDFGSATAWSGQDQITLSLDWTSLVAGDSLQYAIYGYTTAPTGTANVLSLQDGTNIAPAANTNTFVALSPIGSGIAGSGSFSATINVTTGDLGDYEALGIVFLSNVDTVGRVTIDNVALTAIPEPSSLALVGLGIAGLAVRRRRA